VLGSSGDDHRIDWGYIYAAAPAAQSKSAIGGSATMSAGFAADGSLPAADDARQPRPANQDEPALAFVFDLGKVGDQPVERQVIVALDEIAAIKYFRHNLKPYWARNGATAADLLATASADYAKLLPRCVAFDQELTADATSAGGPGYAQLLAYSYRECLCACGLAADAKGQPLYFTKENTSNGDIATVDVFFPMLPLQLVLCPPLAKAALVPVLDYSASSHWKFGNAPHDLGTYPLVFGRDDGGEAMVVEESGNMLLLTDAVCRIDGNADFAVKWWPQLTSWAKYLEQYGLDPGDQLCTDDFMGHLAHNANLSVKAIVALAAYGDLCRMKGDTENADKYANLAKVDAEHWIKSAADGDHYRLAFDKPNTWSQKYNLVWDQILDLHVFPPSVAAAEVAHYKAKLLKYGVPLDSRTHLTKTDWSVWSATLATSRDDFETLVNPILDYLNTTTARDPVADSYMTDNFHSGGMHARPVVGGFFIKLLSTPDLWHKWARRANQPVGPWADFPKSPVVTEILPTARVKGQTWSYTTTKPADGWEKPGFDDSAWKQGQSGFGTQGTPGSVIGTVWNTDDIWLRREITVPDGDHPGMTWLVHHDEDVEIYVNGVLGGSEAGYITQYQPLDIGAEARRLLKPGAKVMLAVHCHQTVGGQYIDVGLADVVEK
jgi:hypothetical protein